MSVPPKSDDDEWDGLAQRAWALGIDMRELARGTTKDLLSSPAEDIDCAARLSQGKIGALTSG